MASNQVRGVLTVGIHCDFCHKAGGAYLRPAPGAPAGAAIEKERGARYASHAWEPYRNMPGVLSLRMLRPPDGEQIFIGPFPDIHDPDTYLPLMDENALCAPCHEFSFWGTPIYKSYSEWLASPYANPDTGQTCQDCHMAPNGDTLFALVEQGGIEHPPETIPSHLQLGATSEELLANTLDLELEAKLQGGMIQVTVTVTNSGAGHHAPTDHPGRHLLLVVEVTDSQGTPMGLVHGPTVPQWGGSLAGLPGKGYAKLLQDVVTGESPVVSYWTQTVILSDTRLAALEADEETSSFAAPFGDATVTATIYFRRLFEPIALRYGWDLGQVEMERATLTVSGKPLPRIRRRLR